MLVFITYVVVVFSILVQGLTVERLVKKLYRTSPEGGTLTEEI
jgi:CPA1 family monovalent cation:H+ antiporter